MAWYSRFRRLQGLSTDDRRCLLEAVILLTLARVLVLLVPFRWIILLLARLPKQSLEGVDPELMQRIQWAIATASRAVPCNAVCLPRALAAKLMLARRGHRSVLHLGVAKTEAGGLVAHAWLTSSDAVVIGEEGTMGMTPLGRFG